MKTKAFGLFLLLLPFLKNFAQSDDVTSLVKLTLVNPGVSFERRVGRMQTIYVQPFLKTSLYLTGRSFALIPYDVTTHYYFDPAVSVQFRQYYLTRRQKRKERNHELNSMNYIGLYEEVFFSKKPFYQQVGSRRGYNRLALVWGWQQTVTKRFSFDLDLGYGYFFPLKPFYYSTGEKMEELLQPRVMAQLNIGFLLNHKNK